MSGTTAFALVDALVSTLQATSGLCAPGGSGVPVFDGPVVTDSGDFTYVIIGGRSLSESDTIESGFSSDIDWEYFPVSGGSRREQITVPCAIISWSGYPDWSVIRTSIKSTLDLVSGALLTPSAVGLNKVIKLVITNLELTQEPSPDAAEARLSFDVEASFLL